MSPAAASWTVLHELWAVAHRAERVVARELAEAGVDGTELAVLGLLARMGPATTTELAGELGVPFMTMSSALQRLEARGELVRSAHPEDRRSHVFALSPEGRARARAAGRHVDAAVEALAAAEVDLEELAKVLERLHDALRRA
jgi:DNA-binding MarR family transcriptional regulator